MNRDCDTVRDLMPLVLDEVASESSQNLVMRHVAGCPACRACMDQLMAELPAATAEEKRQAQQANREAARLLQRQKRRRTLRALLLGILIACVLFAAGLLVWNHLMRLVQPLDLSSYQLQLVQLQDGQAAVTASFTDFRKSSLTITEQNRDGALYISLETQPYAADLPTPGEPRYIGIVPLEGYTAVYQGTPDRCQLLWQQGQSLPPASAWMEIFHFWEDAEIRLTEKQSATSDGKAYYADVQDEARASLIESQQSYALACLPETAAGGVTRIRTPHDPTDRDTLRWVLEGVPGTEEADIQHLFRLMDQVEGVSQGE